MVAAQTVRAQGQQQLREVPSRALVRVRQCGERGRAVVRREVHFGFEHVAGRLQVGFALPGARQPLVLFLRLAQALRGARRDQRDQARMAVRGMRLDRQLEHLRKASFKQQADAFEERRVGLFALLAGTEFAHPARQRGSQGDPAQQAIDHDDDGQQQEQGEVERNFRAIGRQHQEQVAVVELRRQGHARGQGAQREQPQQGPHRASLPARSERIADRLALSVGNSGAMSLICSCASEACAVRTAAVSLSK